MSKFSNTTVRSTKLVDRRWLTDVEPYTRQPQRSFGDVSDDIRLRQVLKRAVSRDHAPQSLIDAIQSGIRG